MFPHLTDPIGALSGHVNGRGSSLTLHSIQTRIIVHHPRSEVEEKIYRCLAAAGYGVRRLEVEEDLTECVRSFRARLIACDSETLMREAPKLSSNNDPLVATVAWICVRSDGEDVHETNSLLEKFSSGVILESSSPEQVQRVIHANAEEFKSLAESRVLIVDDSKTGRLIVEHILKQAHTECVSCGSVKEAKHILQTDKKGFDAVLTDQVMPQESGEDLCRWIRSFPEWHELPVIFFSGSREASKLANIFDAGGTDYLGKDLIEDELLPRLLVHVRAQKFKETLFKKHIELTEAQRKIEEFLAVCSHDMKNPLSVMRLEATMLRRKYPNDEYIQEKCLPRIERNIHFINHLIENVIEGTRTDLGRLELDEFLAIEVFEALVDSFKTLMDRKGIQFISHFESSQFSTIFGNAFAVQRIVANLLSNALKFTQPGKSVELRFKTNGSRSLFFVRDEGLGIPENVREEIFEQYTRHSSIGTGGEKGSGLGLFLSRKLAWSMSGELQLESSSDQGSMFSLNLPSVAAQKASA